MSWPAWDVQSTLLLCVIGLVVVGLGGMIQFLNWLEARSFRRLEDEQIRRSAEAVRAQHRERMERLEEWERRAKQ